jgi:hypothetical protein
LRGRVPRLLGWIFLGASIVLIVVGAVVAATQSLSKVNHFQRVAVADRTGTVHFDKSGKYIAYYEADNVRSDIKAVPRIGVALRGPSGQTMVLNTLYGNRSDGKIDIITYDYHGHHGVALYEFHIDRPGTYQVALIPNAGDGPNATIAFGTSIRGGLVVGGILIVLGVLLLIAAIVLLIVGYVKRARHKRELQAAQNYGGGYGAFGSPPHPGYTGQHAGWGYDAPPAYGQQPPGYQQPGHQQPGHQQPGYQQPGYQQPPNFEKPPGSDDQPR